MPQNESPLKIGDKMANLKKTKSSWLLLSIIFSCLALHILIHPYDSIANSCPPGSSFNPYTQKCHEIKNRIDQIDQLLMSYKARGRRSLIEEDLPTPGGTGTGITYNNGSLQALDHAELHTKMFVYPDGVNPSGSMNWLYTTATNHTDDSIEVVGMYASWREVGYLGIFDWSCTSDYPCSDGSSGPNWQWTVPFEEFDCNIGPIIDKGGHYQKIIQYANNTIKLDGGDPPLWRHEVLLWNFCNENWDLIYEHESRLNKLDCSLQENTCAFWGPIFETFGDEPYPEIDELGFEDSLLFHDGVWSELPPGETSFRDPISPWVLFHLDPNRGYGVGNRVYVPSISSEFSAAPTIGNIPLTVTFTDESSGDITDWLWDFGDGNTSSEQNPQHIYAITGTFDVSLTVSGIAGTDSETKEAYITAETATPPDEDEDDNGGGGGGGGCFITDVITTPYR